MTRSGPLSLVIAFCVPVLLYLQTVQFGFTGFDDDAILAKNSSFLSDLRNVPKAFGTDAFLLAADPAARTTAADPSYLAGIFYRPLQTVSFMADMLICGGNEPWMFHLTNTLLAGLIAALLFRFFQTFAIPAPVSLLGALVYCTHPLFVSAIAWIPARGDLLLLVCSLSSFLFFAAYLRTGKTSCLGGHWLSFTLALFCKETAAVLPLLFLLYARTTSARQAPPPRLWLLVALYVMSDCFWFALRASAVGSAPAQTGVGPMALLSNLRVVPESLAKFAFPFSIAPIPRFTALSTIAGLAILIAIAVLTVIERNRPGAERRFGLAWFLVLLAPALAYRNAYYDYLNHRLLLPLIGIALFLVLLIPRKWMDAHAVGIRRGLTVAVIAFAAMSALASRAYATPLAFYNAVIAHNPANALMHNNRGNVKFGLGDLDGAIVDFKRAVALDPELAVAHYNCGNAYSRKGDLANAIEAYGKALAINPTDASAYLNRGNAYDQAGEHRRAIDDFDRALALNKNDAAAYNSRGIAYAETGQFEKAVRDFDAALELNPTLAEAYVNRGATNRARHKFGEAARDFKRYEELTGKR